ncbi:hypothetical protein LTR62_000115 [Meristemomyces frigidus]|uniref:Uncharacterized protein n=1 Tax=Meristemomyces frigidus TaxID=1508187 RepID=A0AAN7TSD4_9PEZI|nr:hypothetical protein LTR62_000115 [Meristemomyces frigidus]
MAKRAPVLKQRPLSQHSRAARRGASPLPKDLSVKKASSTTAATKGTEYKPWLHTTQTGGIAKKKSGKQLTRQQKVRAQLAKEKADAVVGKYERKVADSKVRARRVQHRAKEWEELNAEAGIRVPVEGAVKVGVEGEGKAVVDGAEKEGEWEDVEEEANEEVVMGNAEAPAVHEGVADPTTTSFTQPEGAEADSTTLPSQVDEIT